MLIKVCAPIGANQTKAVKQKNIPSAALNTKQPIRENQRQMESRGFMAGVLGRTAKQGSPLLLDSSGGCSDRTEVSYRSLRTQKKCCSDGRVGRSMSLLAKRGKKSDFQRIRFEDTGEGVLCGGMGKEQ